MIVDKENEVRAAATTSTTNRTSTDERKQRMSPYAAWLEMFKTVKQNTNAIGGMPIRGVLRLSDDEDDDSDSDSDDEDIDPHTYTKAQVDHIRQIMITRRRKEAMETMERLILGDYYREEGMMMLDTSFQYDVLAFFEAFKSKMKATTSWGVKLDLIFGFTLALQRFDCWMHDNEQGWHGHRMIASLARCWKTVLSRTDSELEIDPEFTRPGLEAFLEGFKAEVESIGFSDVPNMIFNFT